MAESEDRSFVEIVREMLEQGVGINEAVDDLVLLGLGRKDARRLVELLEGKVLENLAGKLNYLVRKKIISLEEAKKIEKTRKLQSRERRLQHELASTKEVVGKILKKRFPGKLPVFMQRLGDFENSLRQQEAAKREVRAFLADIDINALQGSERRALRNAVRAFV